MQVWSIRFQEENNTQYILSSSLQFGLFYFLHFPLLLPFHLLHHHHPLPLALLWSLSSLVVLGLDKRELPKHNLTKILYPVHNRKKTNASSVSWFARWNFQWYRKFMPGIRKKISQWKSYDTFPLLELLLIDVCCIIILHYSVPKHSWTCIKQSAVKVLKFFPLHYCNFHLYLTAMITFDWVTMTCVCCLSPVLDFHLNRTTQIKLRIICFIKWIPCLSVVSQNQWW